MEALISLPVNRDEAWKALQEARAKARSATPAQPPAPPPTGAQVADGWLEVRRVRRKPRHTFARNALTAGEDPAWYARFIRDRAGHGRALAAHFAGFAGAHDRDEAGTSTTGTMEVGEEKGIGAEGGI